MSRLDLVIRLKSVLSPKHPGLYGWHNPLFSKRIVGNHVLTVHEQHPERGI